ncbi:ATP binding, partial [Coemansia sp. RSA 2322]
MKSPIAQHFYIGAGVPQHQQEAVRFSDDDDGGEQHVPAAVRYTLQQVLQWPESRVCQWVREQGFGKYESAFRENLVNGEALVELDYTLLKELSVRTVGERVRLNLAIRRLRQQCLQVDIDSESPPPPTRRVPQQQQPKKMGAKRSQPAELTLPATHSTGAVSETVPPSALQNAHAAAASSVAFNASTKAGETGVSIALVPSATAGANPLLGAASAVSAMTSVTAMAAVPTATAADSAAAYAQVPGIKDLPVLPRVSLSSTAIGIGGNAGSILQRANTDMRPFATVQDRRAKQPQPHSLAHGGGGSGGGIALRRHKVGGDTGSPQSANKGSAESSLFHLKKPPTDKISSLNASKESATAASTASPQKLGVLARLDEAALEPMSAPLPRIRMLTSSQQRAASSGSPPTVAPLQQLRDAIESSRLGNGRSTGPAEEIERLGLQFQEFFGTDISVSNLADSLTVKTWNVTITGPENQARQVAITNTSSAQTILDRVRRAFDLDNDIDGDQYSLFSMTSEGGGARCLSNEELVRVFSSSENAPTDKLFLRKRHQLSRPPMGSKRSEHLQRAIERLGNIIPSTLTSPPSQQQQQQQAALPALGRSMSKWESTTEKLTKLLGERPPSELVSQNIEKYFPGNEARARHSIMRRRRHESQDGISVEGLDVATLPSATASSSKRSSRRQSKAHRRSTSSTTSSASSGSRLMQARLQALALSGDKRWSGFSSNLEPIDESLASPGPADSNLPTTITSKDDSAAEQLPQLAATSRQSKRQSKMFGGAGAAPLRNESYGSLEFSDDEDDDADSGGSLSDLSPSDSSHLSDSLGSDGDDGSDSSFCKSLGDSDIDGDEDLADVDDDSVKIE